MALFLMNSWGLGGVENGYLAKSLNLLRLVVTVFLRRNIKCNKIQGYFAHKYKGLSFFVTVVTVVTVFFSIYEKN